MKIKLIWDFRGDDAQKTAEHHEIHLNEFFQRGEMSHEVGIETINDVYTIAFVIVEQKDMIVVRDALRPHRGEEA